MAVDVPAHAHRAAVLVLEWDHPSPRALLLPLFSIGNSRWVRICPIVLGQWDIFPPFPSVPLHLPFSQEARSITTRNKINNDAKHTNNAMVTCTTFDISCLLLDSLSSMGSRSPSTATPTHITYCSSCFSPHLLLQIPPTLLPHPMGNPITNIPCTKHNKTTESSVKQGFYVQPTFQKAQYMLYAQCRQTPRLDSPVF